MDRKVMRNASKEVREPIMEPNTREKMTIQSYGKIHEVYKDEFLKEFYKSAGLSVSPFSNK